jgi:hypothetical protein
MFDNQRSAIEYALASRPRGLEIGDKVCYADRAFEVFALQQWALAKGAQEVGLVWAGFCEACGNGWLQLTETRVSHLVEVCENCSDAVAPTHCSYDGTVGDNLLSGERPTQPNGRPSRGVVRFGAQERHVLDVIGREFTDIESVAETILVARCAELLPPPAEGKRDQRVFLMRRALRSLCKRKDGPLALEHGRVIFCM